MAPQKEKPVIDLLVMTDGRDTIYETIPSAEAFLDGPISSRWIHDDSGDLANTDKLHRVFPDWRITSSAGRQGFGAAIRDAWTILRSASSAPYIFHLEDDFLFRRIVPLIPMADVLADHPHLAQLALRRQPWNAEEAAAGGIVEQHPDDWQDCTDHAGRQWLESSRNFTTNPSLYRRTLLELDWPAGADSEGHYTAALRSADPDVRFGYWGSRDSGEWVHHIGNVRKGTGY